MLCLSDEMSTCGPWSVFLSGNKPDQTLDVEFRARNKGAPESWRMAILSYNRKAKDNLISQELTTVLGTPIQPFDEHITRPKKSRKQRHDMNGYVELEWCLEEDERDEKRTKTSTFFVTSTHDPPYDAVLGKPDARRFGIFKTKTGQ